jgi:hypothetical protein
MNDSSSPSLEGLCGIMTDNAVQLQIVPNPNEIWELRCVCSADISYLVVIESARKTVETAPSSFFLIIDESQGNKIFSWS